MCRWKYNVKWFLRKFNGRDCSGFVKLKLQANENMCAFVNTVLNIWFPLTTGNFL